MFDLQIEEKASKMIQSDSYMNSCVRMVAELEMLVKNRGLFPINSLASNGSALSS